MCAYKYLKWYIIRLTVGRHYMLSNGKYVINMLNPYRYIQRILCPILLQVILQQLRNFMVPSHSGNIQGCLAVLRPWLWDSQQLMTRSLYASHNEGRYWKGEKAMGNICILYIIILLYIYILCIWTIPVTACKKMKAARLRAIVLIWVCSGFLNPLMLWLVWLKENQLMVADGSMISWHITKRTSPCSAAKGWARALHSVAQISMAPACARPSFCLSLFILCFVWAKHIRYGAPHRVLNWFLSMCRYSAPCFLLDPLNSRYERYTTFKIIQFQMVATGCYRKLPQFLSRV